MDDFHNQHTDLIGTIQDLNKNVKDLQDKIFLPQKGNRVNYKIKPRKLKTKSTGRENETAT